MGNDNLCKEAVFGDGIALQVDQSAIPTINETDADYGDLVIKLREASLLNVQVRSKHYGAPYNDL